MRWYLLLTLLISSSLFLNNDYDIHLKSMETLTALVTKPQSELVTEPPFKGVWMRVYGIDQLEFSDLYYVDNPIYAQGYAYGYLSRKESGDSATTSYTYHLLDNNRIGINLTEGPNRVIYSYELKDNTLILTDINTDERFIYVRASRLIDQPIIPIPLPVVTPLTSTVQATSTSTAQLPGSSIPWQVAHQHQEINMCNPTSFSMVLEYYGEKKLHDPEYLKVMATVEGWLSNRPMPNPNREYKLTITPAGKLEFNPPGGYFPGTYNTDLINAVKNNLGYEWKEYCPAVDSVDFKILRDILIAELKRKHPVLVNLMISKIGHMVVLIEYNPATREFTYVDPLIEQAPGLVTISEDKFEGLWREGILDGLQRCAIFTCPKGESCFQPPE